MKDYEITYLSNPELAEEARAQLDAAVDDQLAQLEGTISYRSPHLVRRLAYPVANNPNAGLRTLQVELDPAKVAEVEIFFKKTDGVLRASIIQTSRREEVGPAILEQLSQKKTSKQPAKAAPKPAKPVSEEAVEAGIEKALSEEVK